MTGEVIGRVPLSDRDALLAAIDAVTSSPQKPWHEEAALAFLCRLRVQLEATRASLIDTTLLETGFTTEHCTEIVDGIIEYLQYFDRHVHDQERLSLSVPHSYAGAASREMRLLQRPFRWVAAMVPQNASLTLGITIIASGLYSGARVLLRPSLQCGITGEMLARMVEACEPPEGSVLIRNCLARDCLAAACESDEIELIHYIGSNRYAMEVFQDAFAANKVCLLDGQGNGMMYVDDGVSPEDAARLIVSGATRYNGETCTSINGVLVHAAAHEALRDALVAGLETLRVGDPRLPETQIGPLFSSKQAEELAATLRSGSQRVLCGGKVTGAYCTPAIAEAVDIGSPLVREGVFGPGLWLHPIRSEELPRWLRANRFPLSDSVLTHRPELVDAFVAYSRAARICVNVDPSVESVFEPWGGYPGSGLNPVSAWPDKYRRVYQLDAATERDVPASAVQG